MGATGTTGLGREEACFVHVCIWIYFPKRVLVFVTCDNVGFFLKTVRRLRGANVAVTAQ